MGGRFSTFGASHLVVIALTFLVPAGLAVVAHRSRSEGFARAVRFSFVTGLIATWLVWYGLLVTRGWITAETILPMNLCDWATLATLATLLQPNQPSYELAYFWTLSGTLQALVTPELYYDFPDLRFIVFFAFHGGTIAAVLFLTFACGMRPRPASLRRVIAWSLFYLAAAIAVNRLFGTNFGYLRAKPTTPSLLDVMGPWPAYIVELAGVGILYVLVLYAPFFVADRLRRRST